MAETTYILPHSLNAEKSVLGAMMLSREAVGVAMAELEPGDFYAQRNGIIFSEARQLASQQRAVDFVTLTDALESKGLLDPVGGYDYLTELSTFVPSAARVREYVGIVKNKALLRKTAALCAEIATRIEAEAPDPQAVIADLSSRLAAIVQRSGRHGTMYTADDLLEAGQELLEKRQTGVKTRFPVIDKMTGGLEPGTLIVLAARPGMGKTAFAQCVARNILHAEGAVVFYSLEMPLKQVLARFISMEARIPLDKVLQRVEVTQPDVDVMLNALYRMAEGWRGFHFDDNPYATPDYIRATLGAIKQRGPIDLVIVDYLQLMSLPGYKENRTALVTELSRSMKLIAREFNVPVLLLSQLSRETEKRGNHIPMLSDLRDSGSIEQDADMVWFIHREHEYDASKPATAADLKIAKNRNGPTGTIGLYWDGEYTTFTEIDKKRTPPPLPKQARLPYAGGDE